jgi:hypothetical protein
MEKMETTSATPKSRKNRIKRILKILLYGISSLIIIITLFYWGWILSGSNKWKLDIDRNGVKIYSLKFPGSRVKNFKANFRVNCTMNQIIAGLIENEHYEEDLADWAPGCVAFKVIDPFNTKSMANTVMYEYKILPLFSNKEIIMRSQISIDKQNKIVCTDVMAYPNRIPLNEGRIRISHMHNWWKYTPLENGEFEIDYYQDVSMGGLFFDLLTNFFGAEQNYKYMSEFAKNLNKEKYLKAKYDFVEEWGFNKK